MVKKEKGVKGAFSRLFRKPKVKEVEPSMEEEITKEVKGLEPVILKGIDTGKKSEDVPYELRFWVCDGRILKNVNDLANALRTMNKETFKYHVNRDKNDFSAWVAEVIGDKELAERMQRAKTQKEMIEVVRKSVKTAKMPKAREAAKIKQTKPKKRAAKEIKKIRAKAKVKREIKKQSTLKQLMPKIKKEKVKVKKEKKRSLREQEYELLAREKALDEEEQRLNEKKLLLSKKRIALLKEKGELEKQKFEAFLSRKGKGVAVPEAVEAEVERVPEIEAEEQKNVNELNELIAQTHTAVEQGKTEEASNLISKARALLKTVYLEDDEKRKLEYEILELEADAKLASLSQHQ
jgi:hypothetical protein